VSSSHLGITTRLLLLSDSFWFVDVGRSLWRENGSVVYNCCWSSPAQSFLGPSPQDLWPIFYCLRFETPPTWRARSPYLYPPGTGLPSYTPRHWVPFSSPPTSRRATVEVFEPASMRSDNFTAKISLWTYSSRFSLYRPTENTCNVIAIQPVYWRVGRIFRKHSFLARWTVFRELLHGNAWISSGTLCLIQHKCNVSRCWYKTMCYKSMINSVSEEHLKMNL
jgi:hypothetical protein